MTLLGEWKRSGGKRDRRSISHEYALSLFRPPLVAGPIYGDWKKQTTIPNSDQFSFHTARGVDVLNASKKQRIP